jgi:hypothetical protein
VPSASDVVFIYDTDALTQILIAGQQNLLQLLRADFGVDSFIMSEVEVELRSKPKLAGLIRPQLEKALKAGWLKILSAKYLDQLRPANGESSSVSLADIRELGAEYNLDVETGEAYTHAAAILLDVPSVSNDWNAIRTLEARGRVLPPTILRSFDLFGFFYLEQYLNDREVEEIRKTLNSYNEWLPKSMKNASFKDGLTGMRCRLSTSMAMAGGGKSWSHPFYLKRVEKPPMEGG